jgi:hypothetical protein
MKQLLILLTSISILFFSCSKDDETDVEKKIDSAVGEFAFCKKGNQWTYTHSSYPTDTDITFNSTVKITSVDDNGWVKVQINMPFVAYDAWWFAHDNSFSDMGSPSPTSNYLLLYKKDAQVGDVYEKTFTTDDGTVTNRNEIIALNQTITVIAGTFTGCTKIRQTTSEDAIFYSNIWFSPEIGIIKNEGTTTEDFPEIIVTELHSTNF